MKTRVCFSITAELVAPGIAVESLVVASPDGERDFARMEPSDERRPKGSARTVWRWSVEQHSPGYVVMARQAELARTPPETSSDHPVDSEVVKQALVPDIGAKVDLREPVPDFGLQARQLPGTETGFPAGPEATAQGSFPQMACTRVHEPFSVRTPETGSP
jgi:hypothetical protein